LREIEGEGAVLIAYQRDDAASARASDYRLVPVPDADGIREALAATLGVRVVVRKRRQIFLHHQVRIHLDQVEGLGDFVEFEAVVDAQAGSRVPAADAKSGYQRLAFLQAHFGIAAEDLVERSYGELLLGS
jgi:predicted adenylyl cyclase CyaB